MVPPNPSSKGNHEPAGYCSADLFSSSTADAIFSRSQLRWETRYRRAKLMGPGEFPCCSFDLDSLLRRIPALPDRLPSNAVYLDGVSTWTNADVSCSLRQRSEWPHRINLRSKHPIRCALSDSTSFRVWRGCPNNGVALLVLGWAYILNASLAERQMLPLRLRHEDGKAAPTASLSVDLSYATPRETIWWKALTTCRSSFTIDGVSLPWSVMIDDLTELKIVGNFQGSLEMDSSLDLPTSTEAAIYLARLCSAYSLGEQSAAALAAVLTLPVHRSPGPRWSVISLPRPAFLSPPKFPPTPNLPVPGFDKIDYYLTLSLSSYALRAALESVLWEPGVACNLAGAWLRPISNILSPILKERNFELLAKLFSSTKPSALWLGVAICGRGSWILATADGCMWHSLHAIDTAAWTGIASSFMHLPVPGPYLQHGVVSRADVWRLRHDCCKEYRDGEDYSGMPRHGWQPFGFMREEDVDLEIREHLHCSHQWEYGHWTWLLPEPIDDEGFLTPGPSLLPPKSCPPDPPPYDTSRLEYTADDDEAIRRVSRMSTESMFNWCSQQLERGFSGSVVPPPRISDRPIESGESLANTPDSVVINEWMSNIPAGAEVV